MAVLRLGGNQIEDYYYEGNIETTERVKIFPRLYRGQYIIKYTEIYVSTVEYKEENILVSSYEAIAAVVTLI